MDVSIIIVNYNTYKITQACIDSIFEHTKDINFEVIVIDNFSQDESFERFSTDNRIIYLYQSQNLGFGKANNIGFENSNGKYIFLLNSDTLLKSNAVKEFYDYMENAPSNIACVGSLLKDINNNIIHSYGDFPTLWTGLRTYSILDCLFRILNIKFPPHIKNNIVDYITGADLFIKREIICKYGLFDPDFFMYYEETELQYRYQKNGGVSIIYNVPHIIHLENYSIKKSINKNNMQKHIILFSSFCIYLKKTKGSFNYYLFRFLYFFVSFTWLLNWKYTLKERIRYINATLNFSLK